MDVSLPNSVNDEEVIDAQDPKSEDEDPSIASNVETSDSEGSLDFAFAPPAPVPVATRAALEALRAAPATDHLRAFEAEAEAEVLYVGAIDVNVAEAHARDLERKRLEDATAKEEAHFKREEDVAAREADARQRVNAYYAEKRQRLKVEEQEATRRARKRQVEMQNATRAAEDRLKRNLQRRKAEVQAHYGDLVPADQQYGGAQGRRWKVDWSGTPQPARIRIEIVRAVKDRLPEGRYAMMVSMYDRLGGTPMRWSRNVASEWGYTTNPVRHRGGYGDVELVFHQNVHAVCPSKPSLRPAMVFMFELFLLRGKASPLDRVVAWGAFPMVDGKFDVVEGKFKAPLLRGEVDPTIVKHAALEGAIKEDLDNWLANMYFEVTRLPRYAAGQREYDVELQFTSSLLGHPDREYGSDDEAQAARGLLHAVVQGRASETSSDDEEDAGAEPEWKEEAPGLFYKDHPPETARTFDASTTARGRKAKRAPLTKGEVLEAYAMHLEQPLGVRERRHGQMKVEYMRRQLFTELGLAQWRTLEFWASVVLFLVAMWMRVYTHYFGLYSYLYFYRIPIVEYTLLPHTCHIVYQKSLLSTAAEVGAVAAGHVFNILLLAFLLCSVRFSQACVGSFFDFGSRCVLAFSVAVILDPFAIFVVDCIDGHWTYGDAFKLYHRFEEEEGTGAVGAVVTLLVFGLTTLVSCALAYVYFVRLHMDGRLLDVYLRLHARPGDLFLPLDMEVSARELHWVCEKAERWRGLDGARRKVVVQQIDEVEVEDVAPPMSCSATVSAGPTPRIRARGAGKGPAEEEDEEGAGQDDVRPNGGNKSDDSFGDDSSNGRWPGDREGAEAGDAKAGFGFGKGSSAAPPPPGPRKHTSVYVAVYTVSLDGYRKLHRHFLRLETGSIVELVGSVGDLGDTEYRKLRHITATSAAAPAASTAEVTRALTQGL